MSQIKDPTKQPGYVPVSMPVPNDEAIVSKPGSLWKDGTRAFFKDQRAGRVGDLLSVTVTIADNATLNNESTRNRKNDDTMGMPNMFGFEQQIPKILSKAASASTLVSTSSATDNDGKGAITRKEQINLKVAALVSQVLPNGNLAIIGKQEVRVNYEVRELQIAGVIRREDIDSTNTISYEKIAEARIAYGGHGQISDFQQPRVGSQLLDIVAPF